MRNANNLETINCSIILSITEIMEKTRQLVYYSPAKNKKEILEILMDMESEVICQAKKGFLANCA